MGIKQAPEKVEREGPEFPDELLPVYAKYKRLRFGRMVGDDAITLLARQPLQFTELAAFSQITGEPITPTEASIIMDIDAIFEGQKNG
jgi:hypothetical protein